MFSFLKSNPIKKLDKEYGVLLEQAMQAQRRGDIEGYAKLTEQAEVIKAKLDSLKEES